MQRIRLLLAMTALSVLMVLAVCLGSPYAPLVGPVADIEEIWDIEDTHTESEAPLVTRLNNHGVPLAYDAQENTFYCTLGMGNAESWPEVHLHAPGADGVRLMFADDYEYDFCADAIREGYSYQVIAYTDTEYSYFNIVFTGMMQIHVKTHDAISKEDVPAQVAVLSEESVLESNARVHYRGGATMGDPKRGIKIEFTRSSDGRHKISRDVPEIGGTENLALLPLYTDETLMRDRLCWAMYADMATESESFGTSWTQYVELFVNDRYEGVYLMMEPYDNQKELAKRSATAPATDSVYRVSWMRLGTERLTHPGAYVESREFELYYTPAGAEPFADLAAYMDLSREESDEAFAEKALACMDVDSAIRYMLLLQSCGLTDNVFNNLNIWSCHESGAVRYHFFPWDMDNSFGARSSRIGSEFDMWIYLPAADRMLNLDVGGMRAKLCEKWQTLRAGAWSLENLEARVNGYTLELSESGAAFRNAQRWETSVADGYELIAFLTTRLSVLDRVFEQIAHHEGKTELLDYTDYESRSRSMASMLE